MWRKEMRVARAGGRVRARAIGEANGALGRLRRRVYRRRADAWARVVEVGSAPEAVGCAAGRARCSRVAVLGPEEVGSLLLALL